MVKISYCDYAKVKLNSEGRRIFRMHYGHDPRIDENGFYEEPLWVLMYIFGEHIKSSPFEDGCVYMKEPKETPFDNLAPSWYIYTDSEGIAHSDTYGDTTLNAFFCDVSYRIAFGDITNETVQKIYYKGKEVNYVSWQQGMKYEYKDLDGNTVWVGYFEEWDH